MEGYTQELVMGVMWTMTAVTFIFVFLRLFTRHFIVHQLGLEDYFYVLAGICLLMYSVCLQISARYGFGRPMRTLSWHDIAMSGQWQLTGQTFAIVGMSIAKISLGFFLLRLIREKAQRVAVWVAMSILAICSVLAAVVLWTQCQPAQAIYDPRLRPTAECNIPIAPFAVMLCVACVMTDFFFAIFPCIVVWQLQMKKKEKITLAASMSLGLIAGACGIVRTLFVARGHGGELTQGTVPPILWSSVEMAVTMICIGVPLMRPLYRRVVHGSNATSGRDERYYASGKKSGTGDHLNSHELSGVRRAGAGAGAGGISGGGGSSRIRDEEQHHTHFDKVELDAWERHHRYSEGGSMAPGSGPDNNSQEFILGTAENPLRVNPVINR